MELFIDRLEKTLNSKSVTKTELAEKIGLRRPTISEWKKNGAIPDADVCFRIAEYLGVSAEWLVLGKEKSASSAADIYGARIADLKEEQKKAIDTLLDFYENENRKEFKKDCV